MRRFADERRLNERTKSQKINSQKRNLDLFEFYSIHFERPHLFAIARRVNCFASSAWIEILQWNGNEMGAPYEFDSIQ